MPLVLDGEIGDAARGIEPIGRGKGCGRADIEAAPALAAAIVVRRGGRQLECQIDLAEEKPGAEIARDEVGVLALPAEPGGCGERLFHHRRGVDEHLELTRPARVDPARELLQALLDEIVIIAIPRIDRDGAALALGERRQRVLRGPVIDAEHDDAPRLGPECLRIGALIRAGGEPAHIAVMARLEKRREPRARLRRQHRRRKPHRIEPQRQRVPADRGFDGFGGRQHAGGASFDRLRMRKTGRGPYR